MTGSLLLPRLAWLQRRLHAQVDGSLDGIHLAVVERLPVAAFAFGDLIVVSAAALRGSARDLLSLVAHELAHVFQQRSARTAPCGVVCDPTLEAEAVAAARIVARGGRLRLSALRSRTLHPVLQPSLGVGGMNVTSFAAFSARFQQVVELVPQATAWLEWAMATPSAHFSFADESALLNGIEQGLHGTNTRRFDAGVRLDVTFLLSLGDADFGNIVGALQVGQLTPAALSALASHGIRTEQDFARLASYFAGLGIDVPPAVASASLADKVALLTALDRWSSTPPETAGTAAQFAQAQAETAGAFVAAWDFYACAVAGSGTPETVTELWTAFAPLAWRTLACPVLSPSINDSALVSAAVQQRAGFATLAQALANFAAHAGLAFTLPVDTAAASVLIENYLATARTIVAPGTAAGVTRLQDGVTRWIDFAGPAGRARFQHDATGLLTLLELVPAST